MYQTKKDVPIHKRNLLFRVLVHRTHPGLFARARALEAIGIVIVVGTWSLTAFQWRTSILAADLLAYDCRGHLVGYGCGSV